MRGVTAALAALVLAVASSSVLAGPASAAGFSSASRTARADDATATNLYVATTGDDANSCATIDAPCLTVSGAVARAQTEIANGAVDVDVNVADGTYTENVVIGSVASGHSLSLIGGSASSTIIHGTGDASTPASVISITSGTVTITGLSVTGGYAASGGGISNENGTLTVSDSTVSDNTATDLNTLAGGGGIFNNTGTLTVSGSTVSDNTATTGYAGAIFNNSGTVTVTDSTVSGNDGWYVGGIHNRGTLNVTGSTLSDNIATKNFGGAISNFGGTLHLSDSTLSGNSAMNLNLGSGGAIYNKGPATVTNSTLSGNSAYQGGGIYTQSKLLTVSNSTLSDNTQTEQLAGQVRPGGGIYARSSPFVAISNSILSGSSCNQKYAAVDGGYNVSDDSTCFTALGPTSIQDSTTIGLEPLAANGSNGPWTMAIDAASSAHHLVPSCTGTDERGLSRPGYGGSANCDAGAYEVQGAAPAVTTDPQSQTFWIGSDATFAAAASGTPSPTVKWQVNTGSAWADVSGAAATTLTVPNVTFAMSGNAYRAVFANGVGADAISAAATLTVPVPAILPIDKPQAPGPVAGVTTTPVPSPGSAPGPGTGHVPSPESPPASNPDKPEVSKVGSARGATKRLNVKVTEAGRIRTSGSGLQRRYRTVPKAGTYRVPVKLSKRARRALSRTGHVTVRVTVRFTSASGGRASTHVHVTFERHAKHRSRR
jgi:hypothetical protein